MKKEKWMNYFILCFPFIDFFTSICTWNSWPSIGVFLKGVFFFLSLLFLFKKKKKNVLICLIFFLSYTIIDLLFVSQDVVVDEFMMLVKIFYLPILILFFEEFEIPSKNFYFLAISYLLLYVLFAPFGLGHNMNELYPNKNMYLSYFYIGNELVNVFLILIPLAFLFVMEKKKTFKLLLLSFLTIWMITLLGTKTMYLSIFIILCAFFYLYKDKWISKWKPILLTLVIGLLGFFFFLPKTSFYQNIKTTLEYYQITSFRDLFTLQNINHVLFSNRFTFWKTVDDEYQESRHLIQMFGLEPSDSRQKIEIDICDIFYQLGVIGFFVYLVVFVLAIKSSSIGGLSKFLAIFLFLVSSFTGHVLFSPMTSTYYAMLFRKNIW